MIRTIIQNMKSPLNNNIEDLHPELQRVYKIALERYEKKYPLGPKISLNETARNKLIQDAYYAQGRVNLAPLNELRKKAGLWAIKLAEAKNIISNAKFGQSPHNFEPARAFDVAATDKHGVYLGTSPYYLYFWLICDEVAKQLQIEIVWGGTWKDFPHIELKNWRKM